MRAPLRPPPATGSSIQWGPWAGVGMAHANAALLARIEKSGLGLVVPHRGLEALQEVLSGAGAGSLVQVSGGGGARQHGQH